jgi:hypothetical protein
MTETDLLKTNPLPPPGPERPLATVPTVPLAPMSGAEIRKEATRILGDMIGNPDVTVEKVEAIGRMLDRNADREARQQFDFAMAAFHAECPPIPKRGVNEFFKVIRNGIKVPSTYTLFEDADATIRPVASKFGLGHRFGDAVVDHEKKTITVTCVVSHCGGHRESSSSTMPTESNAGCSPCQKWGTAITYAKKDALLGAYGRTGAEMDLDGNDVDGPAETISQAQEETLNDLLIEVAADRPGEVAGARLDEWRTRMLKFASTDNNKVENLADIPAGKYDAVEEIMLDRLAKLRKG